MGTTLSATRPAILPAIDTRKVDAEQLTTGHAPSFQQRLPILKEYVVVGGDWVVFQRHFLAHQEMAGWTEA
ncbi:unnamed protein product [Lampetra fluviatilis]